MIEIYSSEETDAANTAFGEKLDALAAYVTALEGRVAALETPKPPPPGVQFGVALPDQTANTLKAFKAKVPRTQYHRVYYTPEQSALTRIPATFADSFGAAASGLGMRAVISFKPDVSQAAAGQYDAWAKAFAASCPAGTIVTIQHEPEQKTKNITPAQFKACVEPIFKAMSGTKVIRAVCLMEYQFRTLGPTYGYANIDPAMVDMVAVDAYNNSGSWRSVEQCCKPFFEALKRTYPDVMFGVFETGTELSEGNITNADRALWVNNGLKWANDYGVSVFCYYQTVGTGNWVLSDDELSRIK